MNPTPSEQNSIITMGQARFTIIAQECIRLEFSGDSTFLDDPTLFAVNRDARYHEYEWGESDGELWIDTGTIRLTYRPDGKVFNPRNLKAVIKKGYELVTWKPRDKNEGNLGGTTKTLDGFYGEGGVGEGLLSRDGWFLLDDAKTKHGAPASHILKNDWIEQRPWGRTKDWYLFGYGSDYKAALRAFFSISGPVPMLRKIVLGSWYCRWWDYTSDNFRELVQEYKENDFPLDIMVMDMGWHTYGGTSGYGWAGNLGWTGFSWNRELLPDVEVLLQELHDEGLHTALNVHPHDGIRNHEDMYPEFMKELGHDPESQENLTFDAGNPAYMNAYFKYSHQPHEEIGIDFWWVDWQQDALFPYVNEIPYLEHLPWLNYLYYQNSRKNGRRGLSYSRWGGWGDHRHPIHFSGDTDSNWKVLAWEVPFSAISGNVGCFFWAHDTGGFMGERNSELFARWVQFSAMGVSLRLHSTNSDELDRRPWKWGEAFESSMRKSYHLRSRLLPYIYTSIWQCHTQALPLIRPMYLEWPDIEEAYQHPQEYLLGDSILVAPIVRPGIGPEHLALQKVWFPEGRWYNFFSGEMIEGPQTLIVTATLDEFPLYVRGGVPIPMQPYTPRMGTAKTEQLVIRLYPEQLGKIHESILYEDDGLTEAFTQGQSSTTLMRTERREDGFQIEIEDTKGNYEGQTEDRSFTIELMGTKEITSIIADGIKFDHHYDDKVYCNVINLPSQSIRKRISLKLNVEEIDPLLIKEKALRGQIQAFPGDTTSMSNWNEVASAVDITDSDSSAEIEETLSFLTGVTDLDAQPDIPVGKPFSDPNW